MVYLNPEEPTFFRVPYYDLLIQVLKTVGSSQRVKVGLRVSPRRHSRSRVVMACSYTSLSSWGLAFQVRAFGVIVYPKAPKGVMGLLGEGLGFGG